MIGIANVMLAFLYLSIIAFYGLGYLRLFWMGFGRRLPTDFPSLKVLKWEFIIGAGVQVTLIPTTTLCMFMQNASSPGAKRFAEVALRFLPQSCLIYPVILNSVLLLCLGRRVEWKAVSGFNKCLLGLLPMIGITAAIGFGLIDPMRHPDIPFFAWLFLMVECLLISVWLLLNLGDRWSQVMPQPQPHRGLKWPIHITGFIALVFPVWPIAMYVLMV